MQHLGHLLNLIRTAAHKHKDDTNKVMKAIPNTFIALKSFGREFRTLRISFSVMMLSLSSLLFFQRITQLVELLFPDGTFLTFQ